MRDTSRARPSSSTTSKGELERGGAASRISRTKTATSRARHLRRNATHAEKNLWRVPQRIQLNGFSFRRQHPLGNYIVDFYCPAVRLVVEVDGGQRNEPGAQAVDERRSRILRSKGITVLRFWNNEDDMSLHAAATPTLRPANFTLTLPLSEEGDSQ